MNHQKFIYAKHLFPMKRLLCPQEAICPCLRHHTQDSCPSHATPISNTFTALITGVSPPSSMAIYQASKLSVFSTVSETLGENFDDKTNPAVEICLSKISLFDDNDNVGRI